MKTVAVIQARLQSTRLPQKVLAMLAGKTMLQRVVERTSLAQTVDQVVVATSNQHADRQLVNYCRAMGWPVVAGSEHDVLSRYVLAADTFQADRIVRITSDCPLIDPQLIDQTIATGIVQQTDYACNFYPRRWYPRGLDCEMLTRPSLERLDRIAKSDRYREHVTLMIYDSLRDSGQAKFSMASISPPQDWSHLRWTVDTEQDLQLIQLIYQQLGDSEFTWTDVLDLLKRFPGWVEINQDTKQKVA